MTAVTKQTTPFESNLISPPGLALVNHGRAYVLPMLLSVIFFSDSRLETDYLEMYRNDLHGIFRIGTHMGGHNQSDLLFAIAQGTLLW